MREESVALTALGRATCLWNDAHGWSRLPEAEEVVGWLMAEIERQKALVNRWGNECLRLNSVRDELETENARLRAALEPTEENAEALQESIEMYLGNTHRPLAYNILAVLRERTGGKR